MNRRVLLVGLIALALASVFIFRRRGDAPAIGSFRPIPETSRVEGARTGAAGIVISETGVAATSAVGAGGDSRGESANDRFREWVARYFAASEPVRKDLVVEGVELANARRLQLAALIRENPQAALSAAVPVAVSRQLPAPVTALLERRVSGVGELNVRHLDWVDAGKLRGETRITAVVDGQRYDAFVYGRRVGQPSTSRAYLHGIAVDGALAVSDSPLRQVEPAEPFSEVLDVEVGGNAQPVMAKAGDMTLRFSNHSALEEMEKRLAHSEARPSEETDWRKEIVALARDIEAGQPFSALAAATNRSLGPKRVLVVRVDFPDKPGEPKNYDEQACTAEMLQAVNQGEIAPFYAQSSAGRTSLNFEIAPKIYRTARSTATFVANAQSSGSDALLADVMAAVGSDYDWASYDHAIMVFSGLDGYPAGMAAGHDIWISGSYRFSVVAHEIGHNYGWGHARMWIGTENPLDDDGFSWEYGDLFDVMGSGSLPEAFGFHVSTMATWGWLTDEQTTTAVKDGTFRIYASDRNGLSPTVRGLLGVRLLAPSNRCYWISFRTPYAAGDRGYSAGAHVVRMVVDARSTDLIPLNNTEQTPYGSMSAEQMLLQIGSGFSDNSAGVSVKVTGTGGTGRERYIDIAVAFSPTPVAPEIGYQPRDQLNVRNGASALFSVWARSGMPTVASRWQCQSGGAGPWVDLADDGTFSGAGTQNLVIKAATLAMSQDLFRCRLESAGGSVVSNAARLTVVDVTSGIYILAGGAEGYVDGPGAVARFAFPMGIAEAKDGSLYVVDARNNRVRIVAQNGNVSTLVGPFSAPRGVCVDAAGNLYVSDANASVVWKRTPAGMTSVHAGVQWNSGSADGPFGTARLRRPVGLACDGGGNVYVTDASDHTVRKIAPNGTVTTLAGRAGEQGYLDGVGGEARFHFTDGGNNGIRVDADGTLFVADRGNSCVRRIDATNEVTTVVGSPDRMGTMNGVPPNDAVGSVADIAFDGEGNLLVADGNQYIGVVGRDGVLSLLGGGYGASDRTGMGMAGPQSITVRADGALVIAGARTNSILVYVPTAPVVTRQPADAVGLPIGGRALFAVETVGAWPVPRFRWQERSGSAGALTDVVEGGQFSGATTRLLYVTGVTADLQGRQFRCVVKNSTGEAISNSASLSVALTGPFLVAGSPGKHEGRLSMSNDAEFAEPKQMRLMRDGTLLLLDGPRLVGLTPGGIASGFGAVPSINAADFVPGEAGEVYFSDTWAHSVQRIDVNGREEILAGSGQWGVSGSADGKGTAARFNQPTAIARAPNGLLYVFDAANCTLRTVATDGTVRTLAGWPGGRELVDGPGAGARFGRITAMVVDASGDLIVRDWGRLRRVSPSGLVTTITGWPSPEPVNGQGTAGALSTDNGGMALGPDGTIYIAERDANCIRTLSPTGYLDTLRNPNGTPVLLERPMALAVANNTLFVAEPDPSRSVVRGFPLSSATVAAPVKVADPAPVAGVQGREVTLSVQATGVGLTYQWFKDGRLLAGATDAQLAIPAAYSTSAGSYTVVVSNRGGYFVSAPAIVTVSVLPGIVTSPRDASVRAGQRVTLSVAATGSIPLSYQWRKDGTAIPGATSESYVIPSAAEADAGSYSVVVSNPGGSATSGAAQITVQVGPSAWITNLSVRTTLVAGQNPLIMGFSVSGGPKQILFRGGGPVLARFGLPQVLADPRLELFAAGAAGPELVSNDWDASLAGTFVAVGAFAFPTGSKDAAFVRSLSGGYTIQAPITGTGTILLEAYDTEPASNAPRMTNISARNRVGTGDDVLIEGFRIEGTGTKKLLIRAIGPTLGSFGVSGALADPVIEIYNSANQVVFTNDNWDAALSASFDVVGAFPLTPGSKDAALVATLQPGSYTAVVKGVNGATGEALVEVYDMD